MTGVGLPLKRAAMALACMLMAATLAWAFTPRLRLSSQLGVLELERVIPAQFGTWTEDKTATGGVVNPQQQALLDKLYTRLLSRTYVNSKGERVMLSIAYGDDQRDSSQLHYPEVCYPAQGFRLLSNNPAELSVGNARVPVRHLQTVLSDQRFEPVTYWTVLGETAYRGGIEKKLVEMRYGAHNLIPDGLLFRVSSIDRDPANGYALQADFVRQLFATVDTANTRRLLGAGAL